MGLGFDNDLVGIVNGDTGITLNPTPLEVAILALSLSVRLLLRIEPLRPLRSLGCSMSHWRS